MRSYEEQLRGKCVHFNGTMHDECRAGVKYDYVQLVARHLVEDSP